MNFTREPIIETVITPREGSKLLVRSSKAVEREEYLVEAVEVISFGHSFFFRSLDRAKPFLVPIADYELLEEKEVRVALKSAVPDRSIKIGGGRSSAPRDVVAEDVEPVVASAEEAMVASSTQQPPQLVGNRRRDKRRSRRRRGGGAGPEVARPAGSPGGVYPNVHSELLAQQEFFESMEGDEVDGEAPSEVVPPPVMSKLLPPPPTLIKETLGRYKSADEFSEPESSSLHHSSFSEDGKDEETHMEEP